MDNKVNIRDDKGRVTLLKLLLKYIIQGFAVAIVAYIVPTLYKTSLRKPTISEIFHIALAASTTMFILDYFIEEVGVGAKIGAGLAIGKNLVI